MKISIIACTDLGNGLGYQGKLLYKIKDDLKQFRSLTEGKAVLMGRKTHEEIKRPLTGRLNFVVSSSSKFKGCINVRSFQEAIDKAKTLDVKHLFIIGGAGIYREALKIADSIYLTKVYHKKEADRHFGFDRTEFKLKKQSLKKYSKEEYLYYQFFEYVKE